MKNKKQTLSIMQLLSVMLAVICCFFCGFTHASGAEPEQMSMTASNACYSTNMPANWAQEWQYNRNGRTNIPPNLGLALSGGGLRSGIFCMGVLQGLHQLGVLTNVDEISSVSGGGYAASWLYLQSLNNHYHEDTLFNDSKKYELYIQAHGELISHFPAKRTVLRRSGYLIGCGSQILVSQFVNLFANGLFGWHANVVPMRRIYENGIDRVFDVKPNKNGKQSSVDFTNFLNCTMFYNKPKTITFDELAHENFQGKLPFPIINTTAHIEENDPLRIAYRLDNEVFEFTPLKYGSDCFGFWTNFPMNYNRAIQVSGAAVDSKTSRDPVTRALDSAINVDLGYFINNPNITNEIYKILRKFIIYPFYSPPFGWFYRNEHYLRDTNADKIYLADGGHSENLGAYSLIRRSCQTLIIVDAEYDPIFEFEAYNLLKKHIANEMGLNLEVGEIDEHCPGKSMKDSIMKGTISSLRDRANSIVANVIYIKLSLNAARLDQYPQAVGDYYIATQKQTEFFQSSAFPQESTTDQSYFPEQVTAYRELGRFIVTNNPEFFSNLRTFNLKN